MAGRWIVGLVTGIGLLGLAIVSGLTMLARRFVDQFSRPHLVVNVPDFALQMPQCDVEPPPALRRVMDFETVDGIVLRGEFWAQPQAAATIVLCHGYRASRMLLKSAAGLHYSYGFNVFFFDFRGHGESAGKMTGGGCIEKHDLEAALEITLRQAEVLPGKVIIHGFSMGAAVALLTAPHPAVMAIVADSPYAYSERVLQTIIHNLLLQQIGIQAARYLKFCMPLVAWGTVLFSSLVFRVRFGHPLAARPALSFKHWKAQARATKDALQQQAAPILLIHSKSDPLIPLAHAQMIAEQAQKYDVPLETYFCDSNMHCGAYAQSPTRYVSIFRNFLKRHIHDDFFGEEFKNTHK